MIKKLSLKKPTGRVDEYPYLLFHRPNEFITRVDKYSIVIYWGTKIDEYNVPENHGLFFYPSKFAIEEIDSIRENEANLNNSYGNALIHRLEQLRKYGNPWWHYDTNYKLTPDNWILKFISNAQPEPIKRLKLKNKETKIIKKHSLKSNNRLKLKLRKK